MQNTQCKCGIKIRNLGVRKGKDLILYDVNLDVHHGEILALIGQNGAGKTTLLKALLGRIPSTGQIQFFDASGEEIARPIIGYVPQTTLFDRAMPVTVGDMLCANLSDSPVWLFHKKAIQEKARELLQKTGSEKLINRQLGSLSGGELQRVLLAFALRPTPNLLLLDEAVSAVDQKGTEAFYEIVTDLRKEYHMPIILISHNFSHVRKYATSAALLDRTIRISGTVEEVMNAQETKNIFGWE